MTAAEFKAIRKRAGLSQTDLAALIGKTRGMIAKYEAGYPIPLLVEWFMRKLENGEQN